MSPTLLVVDDDRANLDSVARILQHEGWNPLAASDGTAALELLRRPEVAVLLTDLMMPGMDGQELLATARALRPDVEVVLMTAYGTVEAAVSAMKDGAYDFLTKPLKRHVLVKTVEKALERHALRAENQELKARLADLGAQRSLVGQSPAFRSFLDTLKQAAPSTATVLLLGESGTGKELAARALHELSGRGGGPFVAVNCARLPRDPARGRAVRGREGRLHRRDRAQAGPLRARRTAARCSSTRWARCRVGAQVKLLRVLQEGEIERLGGDPDGQGGRPASWPPPTRTCGARWPRAASARTSTTG